MAKVGVNVDASCIITHAYQQPINLSTRPATLLLCQVPSLCAGMINVRCSETQRSIARIEDSICSEEPCRAMESTDRAQSRGSSALLAAKVLLVSSPCKELTMHSSAIQALAPGDVL